jgi:Arc/MetJ-type ribon-helix-helix transcriptional regulator
VPQIEVSLPEQTEIEIERLVERDEFINREQAVEELLSMGVSTYRTADDASSEMDADVFDRVSDEQRDPALDDDESDDYTL